MNFGKGSLEDWGDGGIGGFFDLLGKWGGKKKDETPAATEDPNVVLARQQGPTAYTDAVRANLGLQGTTGGPQVLSGMAGGAAGGAAAPVPTFTGYQPVAAAPDPLQQLLGLYTPPAAPATPETPATPQEPARGTREWWQWYMNKRRGTGSSGSGWQGWPGWSGGSFTSAGDGAQYGGGGSNLLSSLFGNVNQWRR